MTGQEKLAKIAELDAAIEQAAGQFTREDVITLERVAVAAVSLLKDSMKREEALGFKLCEAMELLDSKKPTAIGRWKQLKGDFTTPGGTPYYVCGSCGDSGHLNGCEYPRRKVICDTCGRINIYPWEKAYEEGSSMWESDEEAVKSE